MSDKKTFIVKGPFVENKECDNRDKAMEYLVSLCEDDMQIVSINRAHGYYVLLKSGFEGDVLIATMSPM